MSYKTIKYITQVVFLGVCVFLFNPTLFAADYSRRQLKPPKDNNKRIEIINIHQQNTNKNTTQFPNLSTNNHKALPTRQTNNIDLRKFQTIRIALPSLRVNNLTYSIPKSYSRIMSKPHSMPVTTKFDLALTLSTFSKSRSNLYTSPYRTLLSYNYLKPRRVSNTIYSATKTNILAKQLKPIKPISAISTSSGIKQLKSESIPMTGNVFKFNKVQPVKPLNLTKFTAIEHVNTFPKSQTRPNIPTQNKIPEEVPKETPLPVMPQSNSASSPIQPVQTPASPTQNTGINYLIHKGLDANNVPNLIRGNLPQFNIGFIHTEQTLQDIYGIGTSQHNRASPF